MVTRRQATAWAVLASALGLSGLVFMLLQVSPYLVDGSINTPAVALFLLCLTVLLFGLVSLGALWLHLRWPALAGVYGKKKKPPASAALRQGLLIALALATVALLIVFRELDIILVLITFGLVGLIEAYVQSKSN
jgi:uncharacterized membrane protein YidH (DUF202 family)